MLFAVLESLLGYFRALLYAEGTYDERRSLQGPMIAALIAGTTSVVMATLGRQAHRARGRRNFAVLTALECSAGMIDLVLMQLS